MKMNKKVLLLIMDGFGINADPKANAIAAAKTPFNDSFLRDYPHSILEASGNAVGLPAGYQGSSEVGHLNMGAGTVVKQEITRINDAIEDRTLFESPVLEGAIKNCLKGNRPLHLMGLVQDEGVHAHSDHMFSLMQYAKERGVSEVFIHFFADGRDTPPRSSLTFLRAVNEKIISIGIGRIATLMGRYYSMDRSRNWELTGIAYETLTQAKGIHVENAEQAIKDAYKLSSPDGAPMTDEYIPPTIIDGFEGIKDGDSVIHFNYRQDRAIQLTRAFVEDDYEGSRPLWRDVVYCGLTRYYDSFNNYILGAGIKGKAKKGSLLGQVISEAGLRQLRIAETQKFRHVTSFMNGKSLKPYEGEDQVEIPSEFDPSTFALHPEMNAYDVTERVIKEIGLGKYDFIAMNLANCDMVGHTGNFESAVKAVEVVDECVGKTVKAALEGGYAVLLTADHGNAEQMLDYDSGEPKTSHTINPVPLIYIASDATSVSLRPEGKLSDIATTVLGLLGLEIPSDMDAPNLIND